MTALTNAKEPLLLSRKNNKAHPIAAMPNTTILPDVVAPSNLERYSASALMLTQKFSKLHAASRPVGRSSAKGNALLSPAPINNHGEIQIVGLRSVKRRLLIAIQNRADTTNAAAGAIDS